jgi:GNAT superfamily N-acetyltransferase
MAEQPWHRNGYNISTDKTRIDVEYLHQYLSEVSYWAQGRSLATVETSVENSLCFGVYVDQIPGDVDPVKQVGFARVVTDAATFGWLCDVFIDEKHRGKGLSKWLLECIVTHPSTRALGWFLLATSDAHELYRNYGGFNALAQPEKWMIKP